MSSLENTIEEVITEGAAKKEIQHEVPGKGGAAPAAKSKIRRAKTHKLQEVTLNAFKDFLENL